MSGIRDAINAHIRVKLPKAVEDGEVSTSKDIIVREEKLLGSIINNIVSVHLSP